MRKYFRFPLQVDFSVDVGCVDGHVTEPRTYGVDVHTRTQEVCGGCMADGMRADGPPEQRRMSALYG